MQGLEWKGQCREERCTSFLVGARVCALFATAATNVKAAPDPEIPFANHGGVWSWTTGDDDRTIYFEDRQRHWYKATLFAPAVDLSSAMGVRIDAGPVGTLDKWGAVYVGHQRYPFTSFEKVDGPPVRAEKTKKAN